MNPRFLPVLAAVLAMAAAPVAAQAQTAPRIITMSGRGEVGAAPDMATFTAGVVSNAPSAAAALAANSAAMARALATLKAQGIADKDVKTENFFLSAQYAGGDNGTARRLTGYRVDNQLAIRVHDVENLGPLLDALVAAGANQINAINFSISDTTAPQNQARRDAVADANAKAQLYARAAGVTLGPILSISESDSAGPRPMMAMVRAAPPAPVPVMPGEENVSADVTIVWTLQ